MLSLENYYGREAVRQRMVEFLGGPSLQEATCRYLTADSCTPGIDYHPRPPAELWRCLERGMEVKRSLWDAASLLIHLDIEYVNFDYPAEPYLDPTRSLELQRPVVRALQERLLRWGIAPLHLLSGRGHHLVWRVRCDTEVFHQLARAGLMAETLRDIYQQPHGPIREPVGAELGAAFAGAGQALEWLAHEVLREVQGRCPIDVELTEVEPARGKTGREIICIDLSEYGDPLHTRMVRIPFSVYHKPRQRRAQLGGQLVDELPTMFLLPLFEMDDQRGLLVMRNPLEMANLARYAPVSIPEQSDGTARLLRAYADSPLARFHQWYHSQRHEPAAAWPQTYDRTPLGPLPPSAHHLLRHPNDLLLKPVGIRHLVRVLLALGWHPRHIAGLLRSKYERDHGWGEKFYWYDAATRADFYTRLFAGLIVGGLDEANDFTAGDLHALGWEGGEGDDQMLPKLRESLKARIHHERLASRPLHGLFLPDEHL